ncbi:DUF2207 domain-containing protein [Patescibacteria group bacterium]|nr:MAG: DUF2207 domain-containing protein [Patescibacteria group bacterium]
MFTQNKFFYFVAAALLSTSSAAFWPLPADAHADPMMGEEVPLVEQISDFDAAIAVNPDATIEVTEKITVYFPAPRHGIDREIPVRYRARFGNRQTIRLTVESVTDQNGSPLPYALSRLGGDLRIRIGDPNRTVAGEQVYRITYRVARVLLFFSDHDELYWNVTGNRWRLPLSRAEAAVTLPVGVPAAAVSSSCYTGSYGSTAQDCAKSAADGFYQFTSDGELTIAIGWPKGFVRAPTKAERARDFLLDNAALAVPVLVFIILFRLWWRRGRDPKIKTIMAEYEPPDELGPAVLSGLVRERVGSGAISAVRIPP